VGRKLGYIARLGRKVITTGFITLWVPIATFNISSTTNNLNDYKMYRVFF